MSGYPSLREHITALRRGIQDSPTSTRIAKDHQEQIIMHLDDALAEFDAWVDLEGKTLAQNQSERTS